MDRIGLVINGGDRVTSILNQLAINATAKRQLLTVLGDVVITQTQLRFVDQVGPDGAPWKPSQRAIDEGGQTLLKSGALRASVTKAVGADEVEIGTNLVYANAMQYGMSLVAKGKALTFVVSGKRVFVKHISFPGRPFIGLNSDDEVELGDTAIEFLSTFVENLQ